MRHFSSRAHYATTWNGSHKYRNVVVVRDANSFAGESSDARCGASQLHAASGGCSPSGGPLTGGEMCGAAMFPSLQQLKQMFESGLMASA